MDPAVQHDRTTATAADRAVALVTGASSGIGRAIAIELARRGVRVVLAARRREALQQTLDACGGATAGRVHACDVADAGQVRALADELRAREGRCDILVNNAGIGASMPFEGPEALGDVELLLAVNLRAPMQLVLELQPLLEASRGCILNVSSVAGTVGTPKAPIYSATKFGLTGFSEAIGVHMEQRGVRVCCIQPGPVPTPGWPQAWMEHTRFRSVLACSADDIARVAADAALGRRTPAVVTRPRIYTLIPLLRALAPWLVRAGLRRIPTNATPPRID